MTENWSFATTNWISVNIVLQIMHFFCIESLVVCVIFGNCWKTYPQLGIQLAKFSLGCIVRAL